MTHFITALAPASRDNCVEAFCNPVLFFQDKGSSTEKQLWSELKITESDLLDETLKPAGSSCEGTKLTMDVKSKRSRSSPSLSLLCRDPSSSASLSDGINVTGSNAAKKQPSELGIVSCLHKSLAITADGAENARPVDATAGKQEKLQRNVTPLTLHEPASNKLRKNPLREMGLDKVVAPLRTEDAEGAGSLSGANDTDKSQKREIPPGDKKVCDSAKKSLTEVEAGPRLSVCFKDRRNTLELPNLDDDDGCGGNSEELDLVEPWEDLSSTKQWVTSPLHSPDVEELLNQLSPFNTRVETSSSEEGTVSSPPVDNSKASVIGSTEGNGPHTASSKAETRWMHWPSAPSRVSVNSNSVTQPHSGRNNTTKQKSTAPAHRFHRQMSYESAASDKREEKCFSNNRPYSLNLDLGYRCIRDISNQQHHKSSERGLQTSSGAVNNGLPSELELFLNDRQAPLRRNSAPVSVTSVRTAFMIKTCQAKAVPVVPPKVQYSQIPHSRHDAAKDQEKERPKVSAEKSNAVAPLVMSDLKEELENKEPGPDRQEHPNAERPAESEKTTSSPEVPVIRRRPAPSLEVFVDCPRPNRGNLLQRPSFRNRQRPQSLILLSPPFPIMDYPPSGDDAKLLSPVKSLNDTSAVNVFSKEVAENFRAQDGIALQSKMTIPKSGQRLETSTSCFYQPQRRSMIFDSRSHRQIE